MSKTAQNRIRKTREAVPELIRIAAKTHRRPVVRLTAVLAAWCDLAGIPGWTPEMVDYVERQVKKAS